MIYILLLTLLSLTYIMYILTNKDILSPSMIGTSIFSLVIFVATIMSKEWNLQISAITYLVIVTGILFFCIGDIFARIMSDQDSMSVSMKNTAYAKVEIPKIITSLLSIVIFGICYLYFERTYEISVLAGNSGGYSQMLFYARMSIIDQGISVGFLLNQAFKIVHGISYIYLFTIMYNKIIAKTNSSLVDYLPVLGFIFLSVLSTSRTYFTQLVSYTLMISFLILQKQDISRKSKNKKIFKNVFVSFILFITLFVMLGYTTGKSQFLGNVKGIAYYLSGSVPALDNYLNVEITRSKYIGSETLINFYNVLNRIGFSYPSFQLHLNSIYGNNISSNVYTAFRRYIQDYTYFGMIFIMFLQGFFYTRLYLKIKKNKNINFNFLIYGTIIFAIIELPIEERFLLDIISPQTLIKLIVMFLLFELFLKKQIMKERE